MGFRGHCFRPIFIAAAMSVFIVVASGARSKSGSSAVTVDGNKLTFDPKTCTRGSGGVAHGLGSVRVNVLRHEDGNCVFEFNREIEGGYSVYLCRVPVDGGPVTVTGWTTSFPLDKCLMVRQGNVLNGQSSVLYRDQPIPGTDRYLLRSETEAGKGTPPKAGQKIRLRANVYSDGGFGERAKNAKPDQSVEFVLGTGKPWTWLDVAVTGALVGEKHHSPSTLGRCRGGRGMAAEIRQGKGNVHRSRGVIGGVTGSGITSSGMPSQH